MRARVYVTLKPGVHDPAGTAVQGGLVSMGYEEVRSVRIGKFFEVEVDDDLSAQHAGGPRARLEEMCRKLLANTVIESFRVELL
ncbi:MAG: phosphoribosylformylglycinamidine synthase subunit PurS [Myxococcales bacterium]|nr:phosphoribosylformylglycinamidine synthase subunit PurS [Myxococcales bacterium]